MSAVPRPRHPRPAILATALCAILAAPPVLAEASVAAQTRYDAAVAAAAASNTAAAKANSPNTASSHTPADEGK